MELPEQGVGSHRHARHPGPRAGARSDERACRPGRSDRHSDRSRSVGPPRCEVRNAGVFRDWQARSMGNRGAGQAWRSGTFLSQRPRSDLRARSRRDDSRRGHANFQRPVRERGGASGALRRSRGARRSAPSMRWTRGCGLMGPPARWFKPWTRWSSTIGTRPDLGADEPDAGAGDLCDWRVCGGGHRGDAVAAAGRGRSSRSWPPGFWR